MPTVDDQLTKLWAVLIIQDFDDYPELKEEVKKDLSVPVNRDLFPTPVTSLLLYRKWVIRGGSKNRPCVCIKEYVTFRTFTLCGQEQGRKGFE